jgi:hypothetical protein
MSDTLIFAFGVIATGLTVSGAFVFTAYEFKQMGENPEKYPESYQPVIQDLAGEAKDKEQKKAP